MPKTNASIFIDSKDRPQQYTTDPQWGEYTQQRNFVFALSYGRSVLIPVQSEEMIASGDKSNTTGTNFVFEGTSLSFHGHVDPTVILTYTGLHTMNVSIDSSTPYQYQLIDDNEPHFQETLHRHWFSTPELEYGTHILNLTSVPMRLTIDYFTVKPSETSDVKGKVLIIDDTDDTIRYSGAWTKDEGDNAYYRSMRVLPVSNRDVYRRAYGGGTHVSRTVGDLVQIPFTGTSIKVLGFFPWRANGNITLAIGTDYPNLETISFPRLSEMPEGRESVWDVDFEPDFLFYGNDSLSEGDHVLTINVTEITGDQSFILDSIIYTASYASLATMPEVVLPSIPFVVATPLSQSRQGRPNIGAIVGGVVGGLVAVFALGVIFFWRRRQKSVEEEEVVRPYITDEFLAKALPGSVVVETAPLVPMREKDRLNAAINSHRDSTSAPSSSTNLVAANSAGGSNQDRRVLELETRVQELERLNREAHESVGLQPQDALPGYSEVHMRST